MSTPPPDDAPKPEPPAEPAPPPEPTRWKRFKLPVNRKDQAVRAAPLPAEPRNRSGTSGRTVLLIIGLVIGLPLAGCLFIGILCAAGMR